jgi:hypothetical protein
MAANLQEIGYDAGFYEPAADGHGDGKDNAEAGTFATLGVTFLHTVEIIEQRRNEIARAWDEFFGEG